MKRRPTREEADFAEVSGSESAVSGVRFTPASEVRATSGLLGWVTFVLGGSVVVDGATIRRTRAGVLTISWPVRRDRSGNHHPILRPINDGARRLLEQQVFAALGFAAPGDQA